MMELSKEHQIAQQVIAEAWRNPAFKQQLIADPIPTIEAFTGETIHLPDGVDRMEVVDQMDPTCTYFNIPAIPEMDDVELTDDQLEAVAGGNGDVPPILLPGDPGYTI